MLAAQWPSRLQNRSARAYVALNRRRLHPAPVQTALPVSPATTVKRISIFNRLILFLAPKICQFHRLFPETTGLASSEIIPTFRPANHQSAYLASPTFSVDFNRLFPNYLLCRLGEIMGVLTIRHIHPNEDILAMQAQRGKLPMPRRRFWVHVNDGDRLGCSPTRTCDAPPSIVRTR